MWRFIVFLMCSCYASFVYGAYTENVPNGCDENIFMPYNETFVLFTAKYAPNSYTCVSGQYLPANATACEVCPNGQTCNGGTFYFNETKNQGIVYNTPLTQPVIDGCANNPLDNYSANIFIAKYTPIEYPCNAGYYLPANVDECTICPAGNYCVGGTYTFNENINQGIVACDNGYHSSAGASSVSDCIANTITVRWDDGNGGAYTTTCTYGGTLTTPSTPPVAPKGYHFTGWSFNLDNN